MGADAQVTGVDAAISSGGRDVDLFVDVEITAEVTEVRRLPLLVGMSGSEGTEIRFRTATFGLEEWVGEGSADERLRQSLELPQGHPPIDRCSPARPRPLSKTCSCWGTK